MDFTQYKETFTEKSHKLGYSLPNIQRCLDYAEVLFSHDVPVIYNPTHLSLLVGYKKEYLKKAAVYSLYFYRDFEISKKMAQNELFLNRFQA